jgi:predicted metal-binding membrane protein
MEIRLRGGYEREPAAVARLRSLAPAILLIAVAGVCWEITATRMQGMDMGPGTELGGLGWFAGVWAAMMAAMMLPPLVPMALAHARAARDSGARWASATSGMFAFGYMLTWVAAGGLAYAVFEAARALGALSLGWDGTGRYVAGAVILTAAAYELTPAKRACLRHCRKPELLRSRWRPGLSGALTTGIEHGGFCVGSSWALMAVLFAVGVMNVTWMIVLAALVAVEKLLPVRGVAIGATALLVAGLGFAVAFAPAHVPWFTVPM